ncbi:MAG TPA: hypothetical protein VFP84_31630 [Kofleriaceae bacterium]|nr:hypothetical protein [Kofleriaceae bacterium]
MTRLWLACVVMLGACSGGGDDFQPIQPGPPADAATEPTPDATTHDAGPGNPNGADLAIAISAAPSPVAANATLTYTLDVVNFGGLDAADLTVTQRLPEGNVSFVNATGIGWQCQNAGQLVTCTRATLLVGQAPSIAVQITTPGAGGALDTSATVSAMTGDPDLTNNTASATTTVLTPADLAIAITDAPDPVAAGGNVTYSITVTNQGPGVSTALSVVDHLADGVTFVSANGPGWSCSASGQDVTCLAASLAVAASAAITLVVTAPASGGTLANTASVSATTPDGDAGNNTASTSTTINAAADLSIAIVDTPHPVLASGTLQYAVNVTNNGPNTASGITVTDGLPAGNVTFVSATGAGWACAQAGQVVTCTRPTLLVGAAPTITITVQAPSEATSLVDTATVTSASSDLVAGNNTASVTTGVLSAADLSVSVLDSADPVTTGGALTYTVTVNNAGPSQANNVTVVSQLPSGTTFQSATGINWACSAVGQQVTCTTPMLSLGDAPAISIATTAPAGDGAITETSTVSTSTTDPLPGNNTASQDTTVNAPSDLALTLSASPTTAPASSTLTYTIGVTNLGPRDATNLTVTNRLPDGNVQFRSATGIGWTCALAGQIVTCTRPLLIVGAAPSIAIQITTPPTDGGLVDQASVSATTADLNTANNTASLTTNVFDSADLSIVASETPDPVRVGTNFAYTLSVANDGPTPATAVEVDDTLPSGATFVSAIGTGWTCSNSGSAVTCTRASLDPNTSAPAITIVATAPATAGTMRNTARVSSATSDPDATNNDATTTTLANLFADLSVAITDTPDPVQGTTTAGCTANDCTTYTIPVSNAGPDTATGVKVVIQLPGNGTFFNAVGSGWVCPAPTTTITCTRAAALAAGATAPNITLVWKAPSPGGFSIVAAPTVSGTSTDPNTANNTAVQDTTVLP